MALGLRVTANRKRPNNTVGRRRRRDLSERSSLAPVRSITIGTEPRCTSASRTATFTSVKPTIGGGNGPTITNEEGGINECCGSLEVAALLELQSLTDALSDKV